MDVLDHISFGRIRGILANIADAFGPVGDGKGNGEILLTLP